MQLAEQVARVEDLQRRLGRIVPPQVTSVSRKPLTISMEEIEAGKIESVPLPAEEEGETATGEADHTEPAAE